VSSLATGGERVNDVRDIGINLLATAIAFGLGTGTRTVVHSVRTWRSRRFWGGVLKGRLTLFLGALPRLRDLEPSGLIGLGDTHAVHELTDTLTGLGATFEMSYAEKLSDGQQHHNLILVGAHEVNQIVDAIQDDAQFTYRFLPDPMRIHDVQTGVDHVPEWDPKREGELLLDYGTLSRLPNPYHHRSTVVILSGVYGFGTWGGARVISDAEFLRRCRRLGTYDVECLFAVRILQGIVLSVRVLDVRPLAPVQHLT